LVVFSITRTLSLTCPFLRIQTPRVMIPLALYTVLCVVQALLPLMVGSSFTHKAHHSAGCNFDLSEVFPVGSPAFLTMAGFVIIGQFDVPVFIMILSCVVAICKLRKSSYVTTPRNTRENACITMIMLTSIYIILNLPYCVYYTIHLVEMLTRVRVLKLTKTNKAADIWILFLSNLMTLQVIPINSTLNMVVYYLRNPTLRMFALQKVLFWKKIQRGHDVVSFTTRIGYDSQSTVRNPETRMSLKSSERPMSARDSMGTRKRRGLGSRTRSVEQANVIWNNSQDQVIIVESASEHEQREVELERELEAAKRDLACSSILSNTLSNTLSTVVMANTQALENLEISED